MIGRYSFNKMQAYGYLVTLNIKGFQGISLNIQGVSKKVYFSELEAASLKSMDFKC